LAGLYIHIPFCAQFCTYCDYFSSIQVEKSGAFVRALLREIEERAALIGSYGVTFDTLYIGGGTPSLLTIEELALILERVAQHYPSQLKEVTIELNPEDVTPQYATQLKEIGFNRVSLGVQSFIDEHLRWMNRRHSVERSIESFNHLRKAHFNNISIDLIFGFEKLSIEGWQYNLKRALELSPEHISAYQLSIEKGTPLYRHYQKGLYTPTDDDSAYEQYRVLHNTLLESGFIQYELSNFALAGRESQHNSSYWNFTPYFGFGPGAHSFIDDRREWNLKGISNYIEGWKRGERLFGYERLSAVDHFNEVVMLSLRSVKGLDCKELERELHSSSLTAAQVEEFTEQLGQLVSHGTIIKEKGSYRIAPLKLFISDSIITKLFL